MLRGLIKKSARVGATLGLATVAAIAAIAPAAAQSSRELVITIERIRALDVIDWGLAGDADFFARVTIDGQVYTTQRVRGKDYVQPNWRIAKDVGRGKYDVKLEIFDKDPLKPDDVIDINRIGFKRDLDFVVDTR
ncbi:MAG: C2 domain-containing protein, partial [Hyphomicrobium sp.]